MSEIDKETKEQLDKGRAIEDMVESEGWELAKKKLLDELIDLDSINALPDDAFDGDITNELKARKSAINIITNWIREIEGDAEQAKENRQMMNDHRKSGHVVRFDEK